MSGRDENTETIAPDGSTARASRSDDVGLVLVYAEDAAELRPVHLLSSHSSFVGRQPPPGNLTIPQASVSRVQAELTRTGAVVKLTDLKSRNGTFVNGVKVTERVLAHGDLLRFGDAVFKLVTTRAAEYAASDVPRLEGQVGSLRLGDVAREVAAIAAGTVPVLVQGETGVGKEGVARAIHARSGRSGPFRAINCAAIPSQLVESELFGHRKGAFTGATRDAPGLFRATDKGTLLLDEIGDMPLEAQAKLLRVLETREVVAVGGHEAETVDVRIVAATHRDLRALVTAGQFRADLYARLNGYGVRVPPLRERIEDVPALMRHVLAKESVAAAVSFGFVYALVLYDWPFNVRELQAAVHRAATLARGATLELQHLPEEIQEHFARKTNPAMTATTIDLKPAAAALKQKRPETGELRRLLEESKGNIAAVARALDRDRALVHRWLKDAGIDPDAFR